MKNLDLKKVAYLIRLQLTERKKNILVSALGLAIALTLVSWVMHTESLQEGIASSFYTLTALALLFPALTNFSAFMNRRSMMYNLLSPVSSLEKYTGIWSASFVTSLFVIITSSFLMSILWIGICTTGYEMTIGEIFQEVFFYQLVLAALVGLVITIGFVLCIIGSHQKSRLKYAIPVSFISILIAWIVLLGILSPVLGEGGKRICLILMLVLGVFLSIGFVIWGYFLFKKVQFIHK